MNITEKAAYIKGLADGLSLDEDTKQNKIIKELIDLVSDMALTLDDADAALDELCLQVDEIDEDLGNIEEIVYGDDHCDCGCHHEDDIYSLECPKCGCEIEIDECNLDEDDNIICPNCNSKLELLDEDYAENPYTEQ